MRTQRIGDRRTFRRINRRATQEHVKHFSSSASSALPKMCCSFIAMRVLALAPRLMGLQLQIST